MSITSCYLFLIPFTLQIPICIVHFRSFGRYPIFHLALLRGCVLSF
ncbi:MAG: hypothetical protein ACTS8Y_02985 [Arsenophonus sp. ER-EMS1-MAG3]